MSSSRVIRSYAGSGGGVGRPNTVTEFWDAACTQQFYSVAYLYDALGDRSQTTYSTANGTTNWGYADYWAYGAAGADGFKRQFQTMRLLDASSNPTPEEFHYLYDCGGRLLGAGFAQSPAAGFTPTGTNPWYDTTHIPSTRARVNYDLDGGGRVLNLYYHWDTLSGANYSVNNITGFQYAYDPLSTFKTSSTFLNPNGNGFTTDHQETYGYSGNFDYLTSAAYNDGLANASPSWSYDASGNRASDSTNPGTWSYDNLNRMSASPMGSYGNDILGNRLSGPSVGTSMGWDTLNRMTSFTPSGAGTTAYTYRADGLRVKKALGQTSTTFAYDGQMGFEDIDSVGGTPTVTDYGLGARGIDRIQKGSAIVYPILDGHGNMVADLSASSGSWSTHDQRSFDAWGQIRSGAQTGDPKGRYCANLGHKADDESGLTYMRARYYEASSGRFISEDPKRNGPNWAIYCSANPANAVDPTGNNPMWEWLGAIVICIGLAACILAELVFEYVVAVGIILIGLALIALGVVTSINDWTEPINRVAVETMFDNTMATINDKKQHGDFIEKVLANEAELELWTFIAEVS